MNKKDLIDIVAQAIGDRPAAVHAVNTVLETIQAAVARGEKVSLTGFGSFDAVDRADWVGRHPSTGEPITIPAKRTPKFKAGAEFKAAVSTGRAAVPA